MTGRVKCSDNSSSARGGSSWAIPSPGWDLGWLDLEQDMWTCEGVSAPQDRTLVGSRDLNRGYEAVRVCRGDDQNTYVNI